MVIAIDASKVDRRPAAPACCVYAISKYLLNSTRVARDIVLVMASRFWRGKVTQGARVKQVKATTITIPARTPTRVSRASEVTKYFSRRMKLSNESLNPWMLTTIGILLVGATVGATLLVERDSKTEPPVSATAQISETQAPETQKAASNAKIAPVEHPQIAAQPSRSIMGECSKYANDQVNSKIEEVLKNGAIGAAVGAAVDSAGGAIAGGGSGAGKGAAIGGLTGAAGGSLYGLNENKSHDSQYQAAYTSCMRSKDYRG